MSNKPESKPLPTCPAFLLDETPAKEESEFEKKQRLKKQSQYEEELLGLIRLSFRSLDKKDDAA